MPAHIYDQQAHVQWDCTYHIVIVPKYRKSLLFQGIRVEIGILMHDLARRFWVEIVKGNVWPDHIHMILRIPPKYSVADTLGRLKWKSAIIIHSRHSKKKALCEKSFWSRWYCVSTVWIDLEMIKKYVADQWKHEKDQYRYENPNGWQLQLDLHW